MRTQTSLFGRLATASTSDMKPRFAFDAVCSCGSHESASVCGVVRGNRDSLSQIGMNLEDLRKEVNDLLVVQVGWIGGAIAQELSNAARKLRIRNWVNLFGRLSVSVAVGQPR